MNQKHKLTIAGTSIIALVLLTIYVLFLIPGAQAHHCKGPHKNDPGCGGGGGNAEVPLMTVFDCPVSGSDYLNCPMVGNHNRLQADVAATPYVNDEENVLNRIGSAGRIALSTGAKKKKPKPRSVYWDASHVNGGIPLPNSGLIFTTTENLDALGIRHRTVIHVGSDFAARGGDLRTMQPGVTVNMDLWADIFIETGRGGDQILLRFDPYGDKCFGRPTSAVHVTRTDDGSGKRQWIIDVPPGALACVYNFDQDLGDYVFGPFQLIADEL